MLPELTWKTAGRTAILENPSLLSTAEHKDLSVYVLFFAAVEHISGIKLTDLIRNVLMLLLWSFSLHLESRETNTDKYVIIMFTFLNVG